MPIATVYIQQRFYLLSHGVRSSQRENSGGKMVGSSNGGFVGMVKPTTQASGSHDALAQMLPASVRTHTVYCGIQDGTVEEFKTVMPQYERGVAEVAALKVDLIHPEGTPPFMLHGHAGEQRIVEGVGGQIRHSGLHLGHEPDPRHAGARRQAHRRRRLRFHHRAHRRAIFPRCRFRGHRHREGQGDLGGGRHAHRRRR